MSPALWKCGVSRVTWHPGPSLTSTGHATLASTLLGIPNKSVSARVAFIRSQPKQAPAGFRGAGPQSRCGFWLKNGTGMSFRPDWELEVGRFQDFGRPRE